MSTNHTYPSGRVVWPLAVHAQQPATLPVGLARRVVTADASVSFHALKRALKRIGSISRKIFLHPVGIDKHPSNDADRLGIPFEFTDLLAQCYHSCKGFWVALHPFQNDRAH